jgi:hypothetical protein
LNVSISLDSGGGYFFLTQEEKRIPLEGTCIEEAVTNLAARLANDFPESDFSIWWTMNFQRENNGRR